MNETLSRIKDKIGKLRDLDKSFSLFGANTHHYVLNPVLPISTIQAFETKHHITLPSDYAAFLTTIGNGGMGPFYGLEPLEDTLFDDLDYKSPDYLLNPGKPFPHTQPWNMEFQSTISEEDEEEYENQLTDFQDAYNSIEHMTGALAICNYGCGISLNLVVNGPEYGTIWTDDRGNENGIYPSYELGNKERIYFLDWYELWLDNSLHKLKIQAESTNKYSTHGRLAKKAWWKFW